MTRHRILSLLIVWLAVSASLCGEVQARTARADRAGSIAIQHNGRVKSLDSFSRQMVEMISGKQRWDKQEPVAWVLRGLADPKLLENERWIQAGHPKLRQRLGLDDDRTHYSWQELKPLFPAVEALVRSSQVKRDADQRPDLVEQQAEQLFGRLITLQKLSDGSLLCVIPPDKEGGEWPSLLQAPGTQAAAFQDLLRAYAGDRPEFARLTDAWLQKVEEATSGRHSRTLRLEILYYRLRPFEWAWIAYLAAFVLIYFSSRRPRLAVAGTAAAGLALALHTAGLAIRCLVLERPPVSNMFESMIFMNWALMVFALGFALVRRQAAALSVGSLLSALVMIYADLLPIDSSLEVLVPVLRSNYWLTVHVLTIVASYGAFGLATGLGHRQLILWTSGKLTPTQEETSADLIYRVIQLGVFLLGIGTVLGGVWANESWGRFWGWDPKETWALITFLGYLVLVHLWHVKKINAYWTAMASVLGFFLVLMTWYGVNFVLGRGLHSYGQGQGGMEWVIGYVVAETLFLAFMLIRRYWSRG